MALTSQDLNSIKGLMTDAITEHPRFELLEHKIEAFDLKIGGVDTRLGLKIDALDSKIDAVETKLSLKIDAVDTKVDRLEKRFDIRFDRLDDDLSAKIEALERSRY